VAWKSGFLIGKNIHIKQGPKEQIMEEKMGDNTKKES